MEFKCGRRLTVPVYSHQLLLFLNTCFYVLSSRTKLSVYVASGGLLLPLTLYRSVLRRNYFSAHKSVSQYRLSPWHSANNSIKDSNVTVNESNEYFMSWETKCYRCCTKWFRNQSIHVPNSKQISMNMQIAFKIK